MTTDQVFRLYQVFRVCQVFGVSSVQLLGFTLVDRPTQLICVGIFICQHTSTKDIAGQSASFTLYLGFTIYLG